MTANASYLVVYCHPVEESFCAALRNAVVGVLARVGVDHHIIDLYASGFDPAPADQARQAISGPVVDAIRDHRQLLQEASDVVFVHPTWWSGPPALLKGWIDLVVTGDGLPIDHPLGGRQRYRSIRSITVVTTHGSGRWRNRLQGQVGRSVLLSVLPRSFGRRCHRRWIAMYDMDRATADERSAFVLRVTQSLGIPADPGGD